MAGRRFSAAPPTSLFGGDASVRSPNSTPGPTVTVPSRHALGGWELEGSLAGVNRGEIWNYRFKAPDKRRPVLILSRQEVIPLRHTVMVAPVTSTRRGAPSEVPVGVKEGLKHESAVDLDHVQTVERARLVSFVGSLDAAQMRHVCRALAVATGCSD